MRPALARVYSVSAVTAPVAGSASRSRPFVFVPSGSARTTGLVLPAVANAAAIEAVIRLPNVSFQITNRHPSR